MINKKSFTLIELLVVIAVLAGLMALLVPNYMEVRKKSRDVRRKNDLKSIQKALELYKINQTRPVYPAAVALTACTVFSSGGIEYMKVVPQDPLSKCPAGSYYYFPAADLSSYTLTACLEITTDPEKAASCPVAPFSCSTSTCYQLTDP